MASLSRWNSVSVASELRSRILVLLFFFDTFLLVCLSLHQVSLSWLVEILSSVGGAGWTVKIVEHQIHVFLLLSLKVVSYFDVAMHFNFYMGIGLPAQCSWFCEICLIVNVLASGVSGCRVSAEVRVASLLAYVRTLLNILHKWLSLRIRNVECVSSWFCLVTLKVIVGTKRLLWSTFGVLLSWSDLSDTLTNVRVGVVGYLHIAEFVCAQIKLVLAVVEIVLSNCEAS